MIRKDAVVSQAKDVRNAHCPRTCVEGEGERSAGWNIPITLDDESAFSILRQREETWLKDMPWTLFLVRFG